MKYNKPIRKSNIELLRILTMMGVIVLHYNNPQIGGGIAYANGANLYVLYGLESLFVCAVNLFILITGYFMCKSSKRTLIKPLELVVQVIVFKELMYICKVIINQEALSIVEILKNLIPSNWFVILYITLYLLSPMLNIISDKAVEKKVFGKFIAVCIGVLSVYPTGVDLLQEVTGKNIIGLSTIGAYGSQWGYSIVNFTLMYLIGAYIRNTDFNDTRIRIRLIRLLLCVGGLIVWAKINDITGFITERSAWAYCNPIVILIAIEVFLIFVSLDIGANKIINEFAKAAFTVYLAHNSILHIVNIEKYVTSSWFIMLAHIAISTVLIYLFCWFLYEIYEKVTRPIYNFICIKLPKMSSDLFKELN